jgi:signal transduction histidine kinase
MIGVDPVTRVLCITDDEALATVIRETLATWLPSSSVEIETGEYVPGESLALASCMVLDSQLRQSAGVDALRRFRAAGFGGAAVLLLSEPAPGVSMRAAALGAPITVLKREIPSRLPAAVLAAARPSMPAALWSGLYDELRRTQRFVALGQIAARLRHDLSNPMTVISSEAQMLQADETLPDRYRESVSELLVMCRRVNGIIRELDLLTAVPIAPQWGDVQDRAGGGT